MNKKIKIIDLIDKIYHKNNIPKRIKYKYKIWLYDNVEERYCLESSFVTLSFETDRLTDEVEILEDNTEEIEEIGEYSDLICMTENEKVLFNMIKVTTHKVDELVKAINKLRKEKE